MKHIVVIEDDLDLREIIAISLTNGGYRVSSYSQFTTLEEMINLQADAFILDEILPSVSGHIICILLKSRPQTKNIPTILISGDDRLPELSSLCEADAALPKPLNHALMLSLLSNLIFQKAY